MNGKQATSTLLLTTVAGVLMAMSWGACDKRPDATAANPAPAGPPSLNESVAYLAKPILIRAPDGNGVYLVCDRSVWLIRGTEAVRVNEAPTFTSGPKPH